MYSEPGATIELEYKSIIHGYEYDHLQNKYRLQNHIRYADKDRPAEKEDHNHIVYDINKNLIQDERVASHIPPLIKLMHPKLKEETYLQIKNDPSFMTRTLLVCEKCLLDIKRSEEGHITSWIKTTDDFVGRRNLRPEILAKRRNQTLALKEAWAKMDPKNVPTNPMKAERKLVKSKTLEKVFALKNDPPTWTSHSKPKIITRRMNTM